jgi:hypothetical protein
MGTGRLCAGGSSSASENWRLARRCARMDPRARMRDRCCFIDRYGGVTLLAGLALEQGYFGFAEHVEIAAWRDLGVRRVAPPILLLRHESPELEQPSVAGLAIVEIAIGMMKTPADGVAVWQRARPSIAMCVLEQVDWDIAHNAALVTDHHQSDRVSNHPARYGAIPASLAGEGRHAHGRDRTAVAQPLESPSELCRTFGAQTIEVGARNARRWMLPRNSSLQRRKRRRAIRLRGCLTICETG